MAPTRSLNVVIAGDAKPLGRATREADGHLNRLGKTGAKMGKALAFGFAGAAAAAGGALVVGLKKSVDAAVDAEKSQARLTAQLKASGISYRAHAREIDNVIQKTSRLAGLDDEDLQDAFTNIVRVTGNVNKSLKLTGLAADFARAKHMDVAKAGELVGKVAGGNVGILSRYGIQIDKGATATEALGKLQEKFSGQAEAYGKTAAGAQERFGVAVENLEEKLGSKLLPIVTDVTNKIATFVGEMESGKGAGGRFADRVSDAFGKVKAVAETVWPVLREGGREALDLLGAGFDRVGAIIDAVRPTFLKVKDDVAVGLGAVTGWLEENRPAIEEFAAAVQDKLVAAFGTVRDSVGAAIDWLRQNVPPAFEAVKGAVVTAFETVKGAVSSAVQFIGGWIDKHRDDIGAFAQAWKNIATGVAVAVGAVVVAVKTVLVPAMRVLWDVVKAVWPGIRQAIEGALKVIGGIIQVFSGVFTGDFHRMWEGVKDIFSGALGAVLGLLRAAIEGILAAGKDVGGAVKDGIAAGIKGLAGLLRDLVVGAVKWLVRNGPDLLTSPGRKIGGLIADGIVGGLGGLGHMILKRVSDALDFVGGAVPGLQAANAIGKLIGDGVGKTVAAQVPSGGAGLGGGSLMGAKSIMTPFVSIAGRFGLHTSSGLRPGAITSSGNPSYHGSGNAVDETGSAAGMLGYFRYLKAKYGRVLRELIYTPGGAGIKDGRPYQYSGQVAADHFDHVHVAFTGGAGDGAGRGARTGDGIGQIRALWSREGGDPSKQNLAAAVAMAESGGNPKITNRNSDGSIDRGLWQINSVHGALSTLDRAGNARAAIQISSNGSNWNPWVAFKNGSYKKFLTGTGGAGAKGTAGGKTYKTNQTASGGTASHGQYDPAATYATENAAAENLPAPFDTAMTASGFVQAVRDRVKGSTKGRPLKGGGPTKGLTQAEADARAGQPSELDYLDMALANAEATPGTADDASALTAIRDYRARELAAAQATGDPRLVAQARRDLTGAEKALSDLTEALDNTKALTDAITGLQGEMKRTNDIAERVQASSGFQAEKYLADLLSGRIARGVVGRSFTPGSGVEYAY